MNLLKRISLSLFVMAVLLLAATMGGIRLVVSNIDLFKSEIRYLLERDVHSGIVFNDVSGAMNRFNPVLRIENVSINLSDRSQPLFVDALEVEFDFWGSLRESTLVVFEVSGKLEKLELTRDVAGQWWLDEYRISGDSGDIVMPGFSQVLALLPRYLKLDLRRLIVHDETHASSHQLSAVAARSVHREGQFFSEVSANLPPEFGRNLLVKSVIDSSSSRIYLNTRNIQLVPVANLFGVDTLGMKAGELDGEAWLNMSGYRITDVQGDMLLKQGKIQLADDKPSLAVDYHARFDLFRNGERWRVSSKVDRLSIDGASVPGFDAQIDLPAGADDDRLAASINHLPISSLPVVAGQWLPNTLASQIAQGKLEGLLRNVIFEINLQQAENFSLGATIVDLSSHPLGLIPGIDKLSADLVVGNNKLVAKLTGKAVTVDFADQFRTPLEADTLRMDIVMNRKPSGNFLLEADKLELSNRDINVAGRMRLETDGEQPPFMFLRATFEEAIGASTSKYIPVKLMPAEAIDWLDRGIISGYVPQGELQFHGRLRDIRELAREQAAELFVDFRVEQAEIFFAPGWLNARNGIGRVQFHNVGVDFDLQGASYERLDNIRASGRIADFNRASLELAIQADAPVVDALRVWRDTPVGQRFSGVLANLQDLGGSVRSEIDILLPLASDPNGRKVAVNLDFMDAAARAPHWGLELSQLNGRLKVTEDTVAGHDIEARFFGDPVRIDVNSDNSALNTEVAVQGNMASANLLQRLPPYLVDPVSGDSDWRLRLNIAGDAAPAGHPFLQINATSFLRNTRIDAPLPFAKAAEASMLLNADVDFFEEEIRFASRLGDVAQGRGSLRTVDDAGYRLERLDIAINTALPTEQKPGINLYGQVAELAVDDWIDFFRSSGEDDASQLNHVVLGIDHGTVFRRDFDSAVVEMRKAGNRLAGNIDSSMVKGSFKIPLKPGTARPMIIDLDYLKITEVEGEADYSTLRPSQLAALKLTSKSLQYHDMVFSNLLIKANAQGETLNVETFNLQRDAVLFTSHGKWKYSKNRDSHGSSLKVKIAGPGLGEAMSGLGFGDSMSLGEIDLHGDFSWPAPLLAFGLDNVSGSATMKISDGVLNNVEPGSGRFVGLLSLSALPRRLALDFSDMVVDGMEFDDITGSYRIDDAVLYTEDTVMEGPAARIKISGKTGILSRDYDQTMRVAPKISGTLPLIGAISAGSTVGWGLLILQQLFDTVIDDAVEVEYHITGSWDDPQIELIKAVDENQNNLPKIDK